jgi:hypothetical protein
MAGLEGFLEGPKIMKYMTFALIGATALMTAACNRGNEDQVNNTEMNQYSTEQLNDLANEAAINAEADALGNQQQQLNEENAAAADNTTNPDDDQEQNVSGM